MFQMAVQGIQKRLGNQYEPSGDEMSTELWKYHTHADGCFSFLWRTSDECIPEPESSTQCRSGDGKVVWSFTQASNSRVMGGAVSIIASDLKNDKTIAPTSWSCQLKWITRPLCRSEQSVPGCVHVKDFKIILKCDISADSIQYPVSISIIY